MALRLNGGTERMATTRRRPFRRLASLLLAALLLVPVVASAHLHVEHGAKPCATCAVTQHTPVVQTGAMPAPAPAPVVVGLEPADATAPRDPAVRYATSRGPPSRLVQAT